MTYRIIRSYTFKAERRIHETSRQLGKHASGHRPESISSLERPLYPRKVSVCQEDRSSIVGHSNKPLSACMKPTFIPITFSVVMRLTFIYALIDPRNDHVRYIGQSVDLKKRLSTHLSFSSSHDTRAWIRELKTCGLKPLQKQLDQSCIACASEVEQKWIDHYKSPYLLNKVPAKTHGRYIAWVQYGNAQEYH